MTNREDSIYFARLAEQAERYEDMISYMKNVAHVSLWSRGSRLVKNLRGPSKQTAVTGSQLL